MGTQYDDYGDIPDDLQEMPVTTEDEVDPEQAQSVDPDIDREMHTGVGFHDEDAVELDQEEPDLSSEDEPSDGLDDTEEED